MKNSEQNIISPYEQPQKNHKTKQEDITPWLNFFLDVLVEQTKRAEKILKAEHSEKLLSEKQLEIYHLFDLPVMVSSKQGKDTLSVREIDTLRKGRIPHITIKQALSRLVELKFLERLGMGRSTRYRKL